MKTVAVIQARMGSSRLPGKMMLQLGDRVAIAHVIERTAASQEIDEIVLATSTNNCDRLLVDMAIKSGISAYCGDERDVLTRVRNAAVEADADIIIRIAGDCPFVSPKIVEQCIKTIRSEDVDYVSNKITRSFPLGLDVEAFSMESFKNVDRNASAPHEREHVTVYYLNNLEKFRAVNLSSIEIFDEKRYVGRTDLELVLDEAADYFYINRILDGLPPNEQDVRSVIDFIDEKNLADELAEVSRKTNSTTEEDGFT